MAFHCGRSVEDAQSGALDVTRPRRFAEPNGTHGTGRDHPNLSGTAQRLREIVSWATSRAVECRVMSRHTVGRGKGATA